MKNKIKNIIRITFAILLGVLIQFMGITYAKYISGEKGTGQAEVAKWSFQIVKEGEETKTVKLINTANEGQKIAPGSSGTINLSLDGIGSEVDLEYDLKFTNEKNKPSNLIFSYDNQTYTSLSEIGTIHGNIKHDSTKTDDILIYWRWKYETGTTEAQILENDLLDTQDANAATEYTFDIIATATQSE